ncbi:MAG: phosphoglucosamine mutase [Desulfurococcaceae archaeon]
MEKRNYLRGSSLSQLFGTDGIRGIINEELSPMLALKIGLATGTLFGAGARVLIGRDSRAGGEMLSKAIEAGLLATGVKVYDAGLIPTPALQYVVKEDGFDGGIIITASHNPPEYNGIKVIDFDGVELPREKEVIIEELVFTEKYKMASWASLTQDVKPYPHALEKYVKAIVSHVDAELIKRKSFRVLIDPANSVGALASPRVAQMLGAKVWTINGDLSPYFLGRHPEPTPETLVETAKVAKSLNVDLAIAHDADADRAIVIDDQANVQWGDRTAAVLAKYLAEKHLDLPRRVFTAVSSSNLVEEYLKPIGVEVVWLKVGSIGIARALMSKGGICGFEENGGFMYPLHHPVRDGAMTLALLLELMAVEGRKLSEIYGDLPKYYALKTKFRMDKAKAFKAVEAVREYFKNYRQVNIDGVRVVGDDFWLLVRPSGTEPLLRVMIEARSVDRAKELLREVESIVGGLS